VVQTTPASGFSSVVQWDWVGYSSATRSPIVGSLGWVSLVGGWFDVLVLSSGWKQSLCLQLAFLKCPLGFSRLFHCPGSCDALVTAQCWWWYYFRSLLIPGLVLGLPLAVQPLLLIQLQTVLSNGELLRWLKISVLLYAQECPWTFSVWWHRAGCKHGLEEAGIFGRGCSQTTKSWPQGMNVSSDDIFH